LSHIPSSSSPPPPPSHHHDHHHDDHHKLLASIFFFWFGGHIERAKLQNGFIPMATSTIQWLLWHNMVGMTKLSTSLFVPLTTGAAMELVFAVLEAFRRSNDFILYVDDQDKGQG